MNQLLSYSGITTKIKAMRHRLISMDDFKKIANLESPSDFFQFLKNHPGYADVFKGLDEHRIHRGEAEAYFMNSLSDGFAKIYRFANFKQRKILDFLFTRNEVNVLKTCIRLVFSEDNDDFDLSNIRPFFTQHSKLNVPVLAASRNIDEFITNLKGTEFYSLFQKLSETNHNTSFDYETQLDIYYFKKMWKLKDKELKGDDLAAYTHTLGTEIDLLNIEWLFRSKVFYNFKSADPYAYIIPVHYKLTRKNLSQLLETSSFDEFIQVLRTTHYKKMAQELENGNMEKAMRHFLLKAYEEESRKYPNSMAPVSYHLHLKQNELNKVTTALECIRYKLEPSEILNYVVQS